MSDHSRSGYALASPRTSALLLDFANTFPAERIRLRDLWQALGARSFGFLLLLFSLPNAIPVGVPGTSMITSIPMGVVALQMMMGRDRPYLPGWLADRSIHRDSFRLVVAKTAPWLQRVERLMRPRWAAMTSARGERLLGGVCFLLALVLCLPIPFGNLLPAIGVVVLALGVMERDGVTVGIGVLAGLVGMMLASGVAWGMVESSVYLIQEVTS